MIKLKEMRHTQKITQKELAKKTGLNLRTLQHYEQGTKNFDHARIDTILKCAIAMKCKVSDLIADPAYLKLIEEYEKSQE